MHVVSSCCTVHPYGGYDRSGDTDLHCHSQLVDANCISLLLSMDIVTIPCFNRSYPNADLLVVRRCLY